MNSAQDPCLRISVVVSFVLQIISSLGISLVAVMAEWCESELLIWP